MNPAALRCDKYSRQYVAGIGFGSRFNIFQESFDEDKFCYSLPSGN